MTPLSLLCEIQHTSCTTHKLIPAALSIHYLFLLLSHVWLALIHIDPDMVPFPCLLFFFKVAPTICLNLIDSSLFTCARPVLFHVVNSLMME